MSHRRLMLTAASIVIAVQASAAQSNPPDSIGMLTNLTGPPTDQERSRIQAYASYYAGRLADDDPIAVGTARDKLMEPLDALGVTPVFRDAYARAALPSLLPVLENRNKYMGAMNAMQIVARMKTEGALDVLRQHCDRRDESRVPIRLWAARGYRVLFQEVEARPDVISDRVLRGAIRDLSQAAQNEDDWLVLLRQLQALAAVDHSIAQENLLSAFTGVARRIAAQDEASCLMEAIRRTLVTLRTRFLNLRPGPDQTALGDEMLPVLELLLEAPEKHWSSAQADLKLRRAYLDTILTAERVLQVVLAGRVNVGQTQFAKAFGDQDLETYRSELERVKASRP